VLEYKPILAPTTLEGTTLSTLESNYKFGAGFYLPLFQRKQRGKFAQTIFKVRLAELDRDFVQWQVRNAVRAQAELTTGFAELVAVQRAATQNAETLRRAELTKFTVGESSLFILNRRERSLLDSQLKLLQLQQKYWKALAELYVTAGLRPDQAFGVVVE